MKRLIEWLKKLFVPPKPTPKPDTVPVPEPDPKPEPGEKPTPTPDPLHGAMFTTDGAVIISSREAGFVNNPSSSRKTLKIILPAKYSGLVSRVVCFSSDGHLFTDTLRRFEPNEYGGRQRYYGNEPIDAYPDNLWIRWDCNNDGRAQDYCFLVSDPQSRIG